MSRRPETARSALAPHDGQATGARSAALESPRPVLFAITDADHPQAALLHSFELACSLRAPLHVARVLPRQRSASFARNLGPDRATHQVERCVRAARETLAWCNTILPEPLPARQLRIFVGELLAEIGDHAQLLNAALITLPPSTGHLGTTAAALARGSRRPVFVPRTGERQGPLLAATTLESELELPVLREAVRLSRQLDAPVVALHNASDGFMGLGRRSQEAARRSASPAQLGQALFARAMERLGQQMSTVVTSEMDPADAILDQAQMHEAQVIVLGTRRRPWLDRLLEPSVAVDVVNRSDRSVLLAPHSLPKP